LGSVSRQLGQEAPAKSEASGFPCRGELKPLRMGEDGWGELGRCSRAERGSGQAGTPLPAPASSQHPSAGDDHHRPSSSSPFTPGPYGRKGSAKPNHKAGHSALDDQCFLGSDMLIL